jgi:hypothetical protein
MRFFSNLPRSESLPAETSRDSFGKQVVRFLRKTSGLEKLLASIRSTFDPGQKRRQMGNRTRWTSRDRRSGRERRQFRRDRRLVTDPGYSALEKRSGKERRSGTDRRRFSATDLYQEKRRHPRAKVNWPLTIRGFRGAIRGEMKDVSAGGALLYANDPLRTREIFSISLDKGCGYQDTWSVLARVVRFGIQYGEECACPHGFGVEFIRLSDDRREFLRALISEGPMGAMTGTRMDTLSQPSKGGTVMEQEKRFVDLLVAPDVYPTVKLLVRKKPGSDAEMSVNTISFHREMWRTLAKYCKQRVVHADISSSQELAISLNAIADSIMSEVSADEKRERNRDAYQSFADFVTEINARTDLDTIRKAQIIHDRASELKFE